VVARHALGSCGVTNCRHWILVIERLHLPVREPGPLSGLFGARGRFEQRLAAAREAFERAGHEHDRAEMLRQQWVRQQRARHDEAVRAHRSEVEHHNNRRVEAVAIGRRERDRESVQAYLELALARTPLPDDLPREDDGTDA
jgi:hypothetical protein